MRDHRATHRAWLACASEIGCWFAASALFTAYLAALALGEFERVAAITAFEEAHAAPFASVIDDDADDEAHLRALDVIAVARDTQTPYRPGIDASDTIGSPDQSTWAPGRIAAYAASTVETGSNRGDPVALLRIPSVGIEVPVYPNIEERNLNRGAGLIDGTATPGSDGNIGIAAHRDGYFRALKDIAVGDALELRSPTQLRRYRVSDISIVQPTDTSPLQATAGPAITLVTCYPFHFVGNAPQRFIVRAMAEH